MQTNNDFKEKLNEIAEQYHMNPNINDMHIEDICQQHTLKWILDVIKGDKTVLELGYGDGIITNGLVDNNFDVTVLEGSSKIVNQVSDLSKKKNFKIFETLFEDYRSDIQYDVVIASHILEHINDPKIIIDKVHQWLKPGGKVISIVPNRESIHRQLAVMMGLQPKLDSLSARDKLVGHVRVYSLEELKEDFVVGGFKIIAEKGFFLKVLPNSMMLNFDIKLLNALNDISDKLPPSLMGNVGVLATKL